MNDIHLGPANEVVEYETVVPNEAILNQHTKYQGWPDDEKDRLWAALWMSKSTREAREY